VLLHLLHCHQESIQSDWPIWDSQLSVERYSRFNLEASQSNVTGRRWSCRRRAARRAAPVMPTGHDLSMFHGLDHGHDLGPSHAAAAGLESPRWHSSLGCTQHTFWRNAKHGLYTSILPNWCISNPSSLILSCANGWIKNTENTELQQWPL